MNTENNIGEITKTHPNEMILGVHPKKRIDQQKKISWMDDAAINKFIRQYQSNLADQWKWPFSIKIEGAGPSEVLATLHTWAEELLNLINSVCLEGKYAKFAPVHIKFSIKSPQILAYYKPGRNLAGLRYEIGINLINLFDLSELFLAAVLAHELLHYVQDAYLSSSPTSKNGYHNVKFRSFADALGIPCTEYGKFLGVRDSSPIVSWAKKHKLSGEPILHLPEQEQPADKIFKHSKRLSWICECRGEEQVKILVAKGKELRARCEKCGSLYKKVITEKIEVSYPYTTI